MEYLYLRMIKNYLKAGIDLLMPRRCIVCGRTLYIKEEHLCLYCSSDIPFTYFWTWDKNPMAEKTGTYACALFYYKSEAGYRHIPYQIKYHGNIKVGKFFGRMLGAKIALARWSNDIDMIIPVPLHWRRKWSRGYNQAEVIASGVAEVLKVPMRTDILKRVRYTETQTKVEVDQKAKNVHGAFQALPVKEDIRHVLLLDDVFTTGSTLMACFTALRSVFPPGVRISVATLAFVGGP
jgi:ComF family protein